MRQGTLIPDIAEVELVSLGRVAGAIEMRLKTCRVSATCPACGTSCRKVHSQYGRRLADLPWHGVSVVIHLQTRRFFCLEPDCRRKVFTEPLPGTVSRYGRRSCRSSEALRWMTLSLGGRGDLWSPAPFFLPVQRSPCQCKCFLFWDGDPLRCDLLLHLPENTRPTSRVEDTDAAMRRRRFRRARPFSPAAAR
jgi:hypothetical protein